MSSAPSEGRGERRLRRKLAKQLILAGLAVLTGKSGDRRLRKALAVRQQIPSLLGRGGEQLGLASSYDDWVALYDTLSPLDVAALEDAVARLPRQPQPVNAMAAATYLVHKGVPFRKAHEKIGNAVRFALDKGVELNDLPLSELRQFGDEFEEDFFAAAALEATLDCHDVIGGTARARVRGDRKAS